MSTKYDPLARAKLDEVAFSGRVSGAMPGLRNLRADAAPQYFFTTNLVWGSTATRTSKIGPIPFNFQIADIFTVLKTAPVSTGNKRFVVGTTTDDDLFFVTGNFKFSSGDSTTADGGSVRRTTATNTQTLTGNAGQILQVKLRPTAAAISNAGSVYGVLVVVPRA